MLFAVSSLSISYRLGAVVGFSATDKPGKKREIIFVIHFAFVLKACNGQSCQDRVAPRYLNVQGLEFLPSFSRQSVCQIVPPPKKWLKIGSSSIHFWAALKWRPPLKQILLQGLQINK